MMYFRMAKRVLLETDKRLVAKFVVNFGLRGARSIQRFKNRLKRANTFPPSLHFGAQLMQPTLPGMLG